MTFKFIFRASNEFNLIIFQKFAVKITVFYIIFYSCLAGFFAALMAGFFLTIDPNAPTQRGKQSILKGNPGSKNL